MTDSASVGKRLLRFCFALAIAAICWPWPSDAAPPNRVRITALTDIALGNWSGSGGISGNDDVCAYRSTAGTYNITATGDGLGGAFTLANQIAPTEILPYQVFWNDQSGTVGRVELLVNTPLTGQDDGGSNQTCQGGSNLNANVSIDISASALLSVGAGPYAATLTVILGLD